MIGKTNTNSDSCNATAIARYCVMFGTSARTYTYSTMDFANVVSHCAMFVWHKRKVSGLTLYDFICTVLTLYSGVQVFWSLSGSHYYSVILLVHTSGVCPFISIVLVHFLTF